MNEFAPMLTGWSAGAAGALLAAVWEGALLAALVWLVLRLLPGLSAAARSVVWLNVFILMALLHLVPLFTGSCRGLPRRSQPMPCASIPAGAWPSPPFGWCCRCLRAGQLVGGRPAPPPPRPPGPPVPGRPLRLPSCSITTAAPSSSAPAPTSPAPACSGFSTPASFFRPASPSG